MARQLKVYRTPIGFHDAYVAATSQKAALAAWGSEANLFARGVAELVTDPALTREPLAHPGAVVKRLRGSAEAHLAALPPDKPTARRRRATMTETATAQPRATATPRAKPRPAPKPRPSRAALDEAEAALHALADRQAEEEKELQQRLRALDRERTAMAAAHARARRDAEQAVERARDAHAEALDRWLDAPS